MVLGKDGCPTEPDLTNKVDSKGCESIMDQSTFCNHATVLCVFSCWRRIKCGYINVILIKLYAIKNVCCITLQNCLVPRLLTRLKTFQTVLVDINSIKTALFKIKRIYFKLNKAEISIDVFSLKNPSQSHIKNTQNKHNKNEKNTFSYVLFNEIDMIISYNNSFWLFKFFYSWII